jgi:protein-disulfide isomerase
MAIAALGGTASAQLPPPALGDVVLGSPDAPVRLVEYASTTCPACQSFHINVLPRLKARYLMSGEANLVFRDYPTPPAPVSMAGSMLARCAGADRFYAVIDTLFQRQSETLAAARAGQAEDQIVRIGAAHGLGEEEVRSCLSDQRIRAYIEEGVRNAPAIQGTPTIFVNGVEAPDYAFATIAALIDAALAATAPDPR